MNPASVPRRTVLRGAVAVGALLGLAACGRTPDPAAVPPAAFVPPASTPSGNAPSGNAPSETIPEGIDPPGAPPAAAPGSAPTRSATPPLGVPGPPATELVHARTGRPEIALTFHGAGDHTLDRKILEALADGGAPVTVLAVGTWLAEYPDAARMVTDLGHELGNHTWSHQTMSRLSVADQRAEIERCRDRIAALTGGPGAFFRQSAAQHATAGQLGLAGAAGYPRVLSYDLDSLDWTDPGPATVRARLRKATAGTVVSMHLGHAGTLAAIPNVLADLRERGLRPVTAGQLFA